MEGWICIWNSFPDIIDVQMATSRRKKKHHQYQLYPSFFSLASTIHSDQRLKWAEVPACIFNMALASNIDKHTLLTSCLSACLNHNPQNEIRNWQSFLCTEYYIPAWAIYIIIIFTPHFLESLTGPAIKGRRFFEPIDALHFHTV